MDIFSCFKMVLYKINFNGCMEFHWKGGGVGHGLFKKKHTPVTDSCIASHCFSSEQCCPKANSKITSLWWILRSSTTESKDMLKVFDGICQIALLKCCANSRPTDPVWECYFAITGLTIAKQTLKLCQLGKLMRLSYSPTPWWDPAENCAMRIYSMGWLLVFTLTIA